MKKSLSIRTYLSLSHVLLLIFSLGAIGFIWSRNEYQVITGELESLTRERATLISNVISHEIEEHDQIRLDQAEFPEARFNKDMLAVFIDNSRTLINLGPGSASPQQVDVFLKLSDEYQTTDSSHARLVRSEIEPDSIYAAAPVFDAHDQLVGEVCILLPIGQLDSYISRLRWLLMGVIWVVALLGVGVSTLLTNYFSRQFSQAQKLAATLTEGNYHLRIPEAGPTELRDLSHYLNIMAEKLQEQLKTRRILLANVTHELARPLAGLQLGIESLRKGAIQDSNLADDLLVSMAQTIRRFESLIDDIALAAHPETRPIELDCTALAVEPFMKGIATRYWTLSESRGIRLEVRVAADVPPVSADEKRLNQIIGNLVDNAIKFTPRGKIIHLSAERTDEHYVRLMVHDGGQGISPEDAEHIFEPFYQGNMGRRVKHGVGLGLAIAQQLAQAHGGDLTLENHPAGGALAILTLPIANT